MPSHCESGHGTQRHSPSKELSLRVQPWCRAVTQPVGTGHGELIHGPDAPLSLAETRPPKPVIPTGGRDLGWVDGDSSLRCASFGMTCFSLMVAAVLWRASAAAQSPTIIEKALDEHKRRLLRRFAPRNDTDQDRLDKAIGSNGTLSLRGNRHPSPGTCPGLRVRRRPPASG